MGGVMRSLGPSTTKLPAPELLNPVDSLASEDKVDTTTKNVTLLPPKKRKLSGHAANILTTNRGLLSDAPTGRKLLLGE